jgi:spore maturation protein CgeB
MGTADYYTLMPLIFQNSAVNLNITLKSIYSGIPLRCMDIMGCGGFLLTNYQADFFDYFLPEEDFIFYESEEDCLQKTRHYLSHESQRRQIAQNALGKMKEQHTFVHRVREILSILP